MPTEQYLLVIYTRPTALEGRTTGSADNKTTICSRDGILQLDRIQEAESADIQRLPPDAGRRTRYAVGLG